ncbi:MAG: copper amine oxidase N-terminal domain-containing protein [Oscillospiraceae bacterium]|nr:copper amine oxidase N-terminal domain-containing protein [Oscillospiraceae bacterium]
MNRLKKAAISALAAMVSICGAAAGAAAYSTDIAVELDALTSGVSSLVSFNDFVPMQFDSCTYVPARTVAEAAGMEVEWDQSTQTALITLYANAYSDKPVERYAAELISKVGGYGLELEPTSITAALTLYDTNAVIRYNFTDVDGDIVAIGKSVEMDNAAQLEDDSALMIPLRSAMELFGLEVSWNQEDLTAKVSIPEDAVVPNGLKIIANHTPVEKNDDLVYGVDYISYDELIPYSEITVEEDAPVNIDP